jgi:hypothetical protein
MPQCIIQRSNCQIATLIAEVNSLQQFNLNRRLG